MKKIKLTEMSGFRNPTPEEVRWFGNLVTEECQKQIRFSKKITIIFGALAGVSFFGVFEAGILAVIVALILAIPACLLSREYDYYKRAMEAFSSGNFQVIDGFVSEASCSEFPGECNVQFRTENGEVCANWFRIPNFGLTIGTPILIAYTEVNRGMSWVVQKNRK